MIFSFRIHNPCKKKLYHKKKWVICMYVHARVQSPQKKEIIRVVLEVPYQRNTYRLFIVLSTNEISSPHDFWSSLLHNPIIHIFRENPVWRMHVYWRHTWRSWWTVVVWGSVAEWGERRGWMQCTSTRHSWPGENKEYRGHSQLEQSQPLNKAVVKECVCVCVFAH